MTSQKPKHDQLFRKSLENPLVAYDMLKSHLPPEVLAAVDITTIKLEKESFVEQNLSASVADVLFSVKLTDNSDGFIYLLLEHQSTADHFMAFRLLKYMVNICDQYKQKNPKAKKLPFVYPLIIYNGTKKYNAPRNLWQLFNNEDLARNFWYGDYQLVNVHEIPDEEFRTRIWSGLLEFFLKHRHEKQLIKRWQQIADMLPQLTKVDVGYDYIEMVLQYTLTSIDKDDKIELEQMLINTLNQEKGEEFMTSLAQAWKEEGIMDGIQIGRAEGELKGRAELIKMMLKAGNSVDTIATMTGLSVADIQKLL